MLLRNRPVKEGVSTGVFDEDNVYDYEAMPDENWEYPVIGRVMVDPAEEHTSEFRDWLKMCDDEDYTVKFYTV